jgi:NAD-dependent histone deacetylase SIR2
MSAFAVDPKQDCPHLAAISVDELIKNFTKEKFLAPCSDCHTNQENWLCMCCDEVFCSRYVEGHMARHKEETLHNLAFSYSDASVWCYDCDDYVTSYRLRPFFEKFEKIKFPEEAGSSSAAATAASTTQPEIMEPSFTREQLITGLKNKEFRKVCVLTGAGISVAAGIPDFRTPGTGLYAKVAELGLPFPEAIFNLEFLKDNPKPFFAIAKDFLCYKVNPVKAHHFIKKLDDENQLLLNYTQNIDGLELEAGLPQHRIVQAHGHMRTARCLKCKSAHDIAGFYEAIENDIVWYCPLCTSGTKQHEELTDTLPGLEEEIVDTTPPIVKPDIVFFGESLPTDFHQKFPMIMGADLIIVMGTSLKVFPFALLLQYVQDGVPVVLVNRENPGIYRPNFLFLPGNIEDTIESLATDLNWTLPTNI